MLYIPMFENTTFFLAMCMVSHFTICILFKVNRYYDLIYIYKLSYTIYDLLHISSMK